MNSVADLLAVLCMLSPCYANDQVMQIPVPEVPPRTWIEMAPRYHIDGRHVLFVPQAMGC